jgi:hypothetical protein
MISDSESQVASKGLSKRDSTARNASAWLALAVAALTISSAYVLVIVFVRSGFSQLINNSETFFQTALVLHVDFALIVWLLSMAATLWGLLHDGREHPLPRLDAGLGGAGIVLMVLSPLLGAGSPVISDYLLLLDHPLFLVALALFISGVTLSALRLLGRRSETPTLDCWSSLTPILVRSSALVFLTALLLFFITLLRLPEQEDVHLWYGDLFWGAGHLLQFSYLFLLLAAWNWLLHAAGIAPRLNVRYLLPLLWALLITILLMPLLFVIQPENSALFTEVMEFGGGLVFLLLLVLLFTGFQRLPGTAERRPWALQLVVLPFALFTLGTVFGFLISDNDALVPAHYHGMMGAVTLSLMGVAYLLIRRLGLLAPSSRLIVLQARLYAGGLVLVMLGLILSDVPRKALEADATGEFSLLIGRILIAAGGGGALLGTLFFVILMWRAFHGVFAGAQAKELESLK